MEHLNSLNLQKNDTVTLTITAITNEGSGVGRICGEPGAAEAGNGFVVFVPFSAVGDVLEVKILKTQKTYAYGKIAGIITSSPDRIEPDCAAFSRVGSCGGCDFRHMTYAAELQAK